MELADQVEGRRNKIKTLYGTASPFDFAKNKTSKRISAFNAILQSKKKSALNASPMNDTASSRNRGRTETKYPASRDAQQVDAAALDTKIIE